MDTVSTHKRSEGRHIKADHATQLRLLDLQATDTAMAQLHHRRANLVEHTELAQRASERATAEDELVAAQTRVSDLEKAQQRAESDLEPVRQRRQRNQHRVDDGSVSDPKALASLVDEIKHLDRRIGELEDAELEVMEQLEAAISSRDQLTGQVDQLGTQVSEVTGRRDELLAGIDEELSGKRSEREQIVAEIPAELLASYDKIARTHGGVGAAELRARRCTGCQLEVNAADLRTFAAAPADEILRCEECSRILVRTERSGL